MPFATGPRLVAMVPLNRFWSVGLGSSLMRSSSPPPLVRMMTGMALFERAMARFESCSFSVSSRPGIATVLRRGLPTGTSVY